MPWTPTTPRERALRYSEFGNETAASIRDAILSQKPDDYEELFCYAQRIELCSSRQNLWYATDLHNGDGEAYDGSGRFWRCGHKLCSFCIKTHTNRARRQIIDAVARQKLLIGESWKFLTLTITNQGYDLLTQRGLVNSAWAIFRKLPWYKKHILGAAKCEEFTLTKTGTHYHMHLIARCKYIDYQLFRRCWTDAVLQAHREAGVELVINTSDGLCIANCQHVHDLRQVINEVAKYITKAESWQKMPPSDLLNACRVGRWPRMFELVGTMKNPVGVPAGAGDLDDSNESILDERSLSERSKPTPWRTRVSEVGAVDYIAELVEYWERQVDFRCVQLKRKFTAAAFHTFRGPPLPEPRDVIRRIEQVDPSPACGAPLQPRWRYGDDGEIIWIVDLTGRPTEHYDGD